MQVGRLDIELLEAFVAIADTGSFTKASKQLRRTQPSVSMQIKRLEDRTGKSLMHRVNRQIQFTADGETLLVYARRIVDLSNEARQCLVMPELRGIVRIGIPEWSPIDGLQVELCQFGRSHPLVKLELHVGDSARLHAMLAAGDLDLALAIRDCDGEAPARIWREPLYWVAAKPYEYEKTVRLALFVPPCPYRTIAMDTLQSVDRKWRESFTSSSVSAVRVALLSGLGVSILPAGAVSAGLRVLRPDEGFPDLPATELSVYVAAKKPSRTIRFLSEYLSEHVGQAILKNTRMPAALLAEQIASS
ncbi:MAG: LysR family transcriptional regulator [Rhodospirillales bacterium]|nr:LysR family transcriptional regulator [Rhodospirillales bacterium]